MKLYTAEEVGEMFGFSSRLIRKMVTDKKLKAVKFGTEYRFTEEQIQEYIKNNTTEG